MCDITHPVNQYYRIDNSKGAQDQRNVHSQVRSCPDRAASRGTIRILFDIINVEEAFMVIISALTPLHLFEGSVCT
jgi:hypothetical protein